MAKDFAKTDEIGVISRATLTSVGHSVDQLYSISLGYVYNHYFYFKSHLPNKVLYEKPADLKGYSVCLQIGSYAVSGLVQAGVRVQKVVKFQQCLKKLVLKRDDIWVTNALTANYYTRKLFPEMLPDLVHTDISATSADELFIAIVKSAQNKVIFDKLQASFNILKDNGVLLDIIQKYRHNQVPQRILPASMQAANRP